jgi:hypothetical protein
MEKTGENVLVMRSESSLVKNSPILFQAGLGFLELWAG